MVMSVVHTYTHTHTHLTKWCPAGWNPFFDNKTKTGQPRLLHEFPADFYGSEIRFIITGVRLLVRVCMPCACVHARGAYAANLGESARARSRITEGESKS